MTDTQIMTANNELLTEICRVLEIETYYVSQLNESIGGGGISRPTKD